MFGLPETTLWYSSAIIYMIKFNESVINLSVVKKIVPFNSAWPGFINK